MNPDQAHRAARDLRTKAAQLIKEADDIDKKADEAAKALKDAEAQYRNA